MKKFITILAAALAAATISCRKGTVQEQVPEECINVTFTASQAGMKTALNEGGNVTWQAGDEISILDGISNVKVTLAEENIVDGGAKAVFTAAVSASAARYYAVYPYDEQNVLDEDELHVRIQPVQEGKVFGKVHKCAAVCGSDNATFYFHNVVSLIKVETARTDVAAISFEGNSGEAVNGAMKITFTDEGDIDATAYEEGQTGETCSCAIGREASAFYIAAAPGTLANGFTITLFADDAKSQVIGVVRSNKALTVKQNTIIDLDNIDTRILEGKGTSDSPWLIHNADELDLSRYFILDKSIVDTTYFKLANDIDMSAKTAWVPINALDYTKNFSLDGNNKTIRNLTVKTSATATKYIGLYGLVSGHIFDLNMDNCTNITTNNTHGGVLAGWCGNNQAPSSTSAQRAKLENIHITNSSATNSCNSAFSAGGITGNAGNTIFRNCSFQGTVRNESTNTGAFCGGLAGNTFYGIVIEGCSVNASISSTMATYNGGFIGLASQDLTIKNSSFTGNVTSPASYAGGIAGRINGACSIDHTTVKGNVGINPDADLNVSTYTYCGGIAGYTLVATSITNSSYEGILKTNGKVVGGLVGQATIDLTATNCTTKGAINAAQFGGGLVGYMQKGVYMNATGCNVGMDITLISGYAGGILGDANTGVVITLRDCHYEGTIKGGTTNVAGLIGCLQTSSTNISDCSAEGDITGTAQIGGLVGNITATQTYPNTHVTVERSYYSGAMSGTKDIGGILGCMTAGTYPSVATISNCYAEGSITTSASDGYLGGITGDLARNSTVTNCYATNTITGGYCLGGITSRACHKTNLGTGYDVGHNITVSGCIAWNPSITALKSGGVDGSTAYGHASIVGYTGLRNTLTNNWRRPDIQISGYKTAEYNVAFDQDDADPDHPLAKIGASTDKYYIPYHGKAATEGETISQIARRIGWSSEIWDFSGDKPVFKKN